MFDKEYTKDGGRYYHMAAFYWASVILLIPFILVALAVCYINPFWFREWLIETLDTVVGRLSRWRNYRMKAIYMNCDPKMWAALTSTETNENDYA